VKADIRRIEISDLFWAVSRRSGIGGKTIEAARQVSDRRIGFAYDRCWGWKRTLAFVGLAAYLSANDANPADFH